jgi:hypothetical protein
LAVLCKINDSLHNIYSKLKEQAQSELYGNPSTVKSMMDFSSLAGSTSMGRGVMGNKFDCSSFGGTDFRNTSSITSPKFDEKRSFS